MLIRRRGDHRYAAIAPEVAEVYARQGIELTANDGKNAILTPVSKVLTTQVSGGFLLGRLVHGRGSLWGGGRQH
ncbi:MAG: hypothetical protein JO045_16940 [Mycobacterium sp.]|nr:hypothetical protein [Mycobacterium sp.]